MEGKGQRIEQIPIDQIFVLNPRERHRGKFREVVDSIASVGLKRPIKVSDSADCARTAGKTYTLICGQGRMEAFKLLGETEIPAIVVSLPDDECYVQSLIENLARRRPTSLETVKEIGALADSGYSASDIAKKTGLSGKYVNGLIDLYRTGEERLLAAVELGKLPISVAVDIASHADEEAQDALARAYQSKELRGKKLQTAMRILNDRKRWGKAVTRNSSSDKSLSPKTLIKHYKRETERQRLLIKRADMTEARLAVIKSALAALFEDSHFRTLLRNEGLDSLPLQIADYVPGHVSVE
ncbi:MAG: plasmid partitioning protein RepB C-terminal domain-containing protein [Pseudomonadota bacterium]